jgi:thiamine pyrophosphate-dependent acetolactate synthase large subunit-like protein
MGFALPGAIAANIVHPDRRILAIAGDAGFLMNVQEMETATRIKSNIVVLVWEDNAYGLIASPYRSCLRQSEMDYAGPGIRLAWALRRKFRRSQGYPGSRFHRKGAQPGGHSDRLS